MHGKQVYDCDNANHCVNIKNLLEYTPMYSNSVATNEFYYLDATRNVEHVKYKNKRLLVACTRTGNVRYSRGTLT